jgi:hypothetical protein
MSVKKLHPWAVDYEFGQADGNPPTPYCYVAENILTGKIIRRWLTDDKRPLYPTGKDSLFVAYYAPAEMGCHQVLNFDCPANIVDLYAEFRCKTNGLPLPSGMGLIGALAYYGLPGGDADYKDIMRKRILQGPPFSEEEKEKILDYCQKDVELTSKLYRHMAGLGDLVTPQALLRGRYTWSVAVMENNGVPIDTVTLKRLVDNWGDIKESVVAEVDKDYDVYEGTTFKLDKFAEYIGKSGIPWYVTKTGRPRLDDDYFKEQAKTYPQVRRLQEVRHTIGLMRRYSLQVGLDGRNRAMLSPFWAITGRNQPSSTKFIFGNATWLRGLIKPPKNTALAYVDYEQQEIAIAAALSGDDMLKKAYESGDPYVEFAKAAKAIPPEGNKKTHPLVRDIYKTCMLAINYGMEVKTFAERSGLPLAVAKHMFDVHKQAYRTYWEWVENFADVGEISGKVATGFGGWEYHMSADRGRRTLLNWPMQANGADILRLAIILCVENGIKVAAPVHDALLIEAPTSRIDEDVRLTQRLMTAASERVIKYPIRTDVKIVRYPERYMDKRGVDMWNTVMKILDGMDK